MIAIDSRLAQQIVERTMKIIPFNVNVMDHRGIILASGKPSRIGTLHSGAQLTIARQSAVEIDGAATRQLPGVKPGVNLPLTVRGQLCGVVGLTGAPDTVRQFGELVRVTAEMILEQAQLIGELQREKRYREEFVSHLVQPSGTSPDDLSAWAMRLGIDFACPRVVLILELTDERLGPDLALAELHRALQQLAAGHPELLTAAISPRELVMVSTLERAGGIPESTAARRRLLALDSTLRQELATPAVLAMGVALAGIDGVALSYQSARKTIRVGRQRNANATLLLYHDLSLPVLLAGLDAGWQADQLRQPLRRLSAVDRRGAPLRRTIETWFAHDGRAQATANALHIHRNTLDYRLRQISEATGLDLANTDDRLLLYIALQLQ